MEQTSLELINKYEIPITVIPKDRKYWFFRTHGGEYYNEFISQEYIALGFDEFTDADRLFKMKQKDAYALIDSVYGTKHRPGKVYNQIKKFSIEMKTDDIVIIPGVDTNVLHFGEITSEMYVVSDTSNEDVCTYHKRRKVNWIKKVKRDELDPYLYKMTRPHNAISEATKNYAHYIDRTLYSVFTKGNESYCYLDVTKEAGIKTIDFFPMGNDLLQLLVEFQEYSKIDLQLNNIETKVNVQSKGKIGFKTGVLAAGVIGLIVTIVLTGGKLELPTGVKVEPNSIVEMISNFLNEKQKRDQREHLYNKLDNMKVATPEEMKLLEMQLKLINGENPEEEKEEKPEAEEKEKTDSTEEKSAEKHEENKKAETHESQHNDPKKEDKNQN